MSIVALKAAVVNTLLAMPDPGQVADYPGATLIGETDGDASEFYTVVLRNGTNEEGRTIGRGGKLSRIYRIEIHLHLPWDETDGQNLEHRFDARIEAISDAFRDNGVLAGVCDLAAPLVWQDDDEGFRQVRGNTIVRYRKAVLDCMVTKQRT